MPSQGGIEVQVCVDDQPLLEHTDPDGEMEDDHHLTRYIEVKAGQKFKIRAALLPGFHFLKANHVFIKLLFDHQDMYQFWHWSYMNVQARRGQVQAPQVI